MTHALLTASPRLDIGSTTRAVPLGSGITTFLGAFCYYAVSGFIGEMFPPFREAHRVLSVAVDALVVIAGMRLFPSLPPTRKKAVLVPLLVFFAISSATYLYTVGLFGVSTRSLVLHINGLRPYLYIFSSLIIVSATFGSLYQKRFIGRMHILLAVFAIAQIPITVYQFLRYGSGDFVGGTLSEGGSGTLTQMLFLISFYFLNVFAVTRRTGSVKWSRSLPYLLLLMPVFLNETKVSFIFLAGYFLLASDIRRRKMSGIFIVAILAVILVVFMTVYVDVTGLEFKEYFTEDFIYGYLFETDVSYDNFGTEDFFDIPRMARIALLLEYWKFEPMPMIFGEGYGVLKGQHLLGSDTTNFLMYLLVGSKNLIFTFLVQGGMLLLIAGSIFLARLTWRRPPGALPAAFLRLRAFVGLEVLVGFFYNDAFLHPLLCSLLIFLLIRLREEGAKQERIGEKAPGGIAG